jgi:hypothetical protein
MVRDCNETVSGTVGFDKAEAQCRFILVSYDTAA